MLRQIQCYLVIYRFDTKLRGVENPGHLKFKYYLLNISGSYDFQYLKVIFYSFLHFCSYMSC